MPVNVFYTPFEYKGSTKELFSKAIENLPGPDYSKILYIAPNPWKIRDAQRIFHAFMGDCYIPPTMMTLSQFSKRLFSLYENRKIIPKALIPVMLSKLSHSSLGYSCLIADFLHEMKQYHSGKSISSFSSDIRSLFDRLGIPGEVSLRAMESLKILDIYEETLKKCNAADENDAMEKCPEIIRKQNIRYGSLIIDGFIELTGTEEEIMKALIEISDETVISIPYDIEFTFISDRYTSFLNNNFILNEVHLPHKKLSMSLAHYPYPGIEEEIEGIARRIKHLFIAGISTELETVFVVFPELHACSDMIGRVFKKYGIPFTIISEKPLAKTRPFLDLLALLDSVSNDYSKLQFSQFLISPYFKALPSSLREYIPSLSISSGFTRGKSAWLNLMKSVRKSAHKEFISSTTSQILEKDIGWVFRKLSPLESICHKASFNGYCEAVTKLLNDLDFDDSVTGGSNNRDMVIEILNDLSLADSFSDHSPADFRTFTEALRHYLLKATSPEPETSGVSIMRFMDLYGLEPEHLYFGGLRDGDFPSKPDIDHLMPDSVRTELGLVNMQKYLLLQKFNFRRALSSAKHYYLSYSVMEGDRMFLPSSFLSWNEEITNPVYGIFSKEENLVRGRKSLRSSIVSDIRTTDKRSIQKMFGVKSSIRVTDIDAYRACPRKFFIERVLSLKPLEIIKFEMEALTLGTVVHEIMQALLSSTFEDLNTLSLNAESTIDAILSGKPYEEYWKNVLKETFLSVLPDIYELEQQIADDGYAFMGAEVPVNGEVLDGIILKGKIDRIDKKINHGESGLKADEKGMSRPIESLSGMPVLELIDYKTGSTQFSGTQILSQGASLQLLLYAALMKSKGMIVDRVGIYSLKDLSLTWIPNRKDRKNNRTMEDYVTACLGFLRETVPDMRKGNFPAQPLNEQVCRNCPEKPYCPYIQKAAFH
jgi:ATP-dependent helicase/DNAse subunit B